MSQTKAQLIDNLVQPITGALGSASAPTFSFTADPNTGIYSPGADQLAISTGGTGRLFVDANGKIGIGGVPSGSYPLEVLSGASDANSLFDATNANGPHIRFAASGTVRHYLGCAPGFTTNGTSSDFAIRTAGYLALATGGNNERLRITSAGLVGVGGSPIAARLASFTADVGGTIGNTAQIVSVNTNGAVGDFSGIRFNYFNDGNTGGKFAYIGSVLTSDVSNGASDIVFGTRPTSTTTISERLRITSAGLVGVGTSSPVLPLTVAGAIAVGAAGNNGIQFYNASPTATALRWLIANNQGDSDKLSIYRYDSSGNFAGTPLVIDSSNRVGIGTNSPSSLLHVSGSNADIRLTDTSVTNATWRLLAQTAGTTKLFRIYDDSNAADRLVIDSSGRVGIGTITAESLLTLKAADTNALFIKTADSNYSSLALGINSSINAAYIQSNKSGSGTERSLAFYGALSEWARFDTSGRFLVGTSTARANFFNQASTYTPKIQLEGSDASSGGTMVSAVCAGSNGFAGYLILGKHRGSVGGTPTIVNNGDLPGYISFQAGDGSEMVEAAAIYAEIDGTPGANDMPGRIVLATTADGANSPTERMRLAQDGRFNLFNSGSATAILQTASAAGTTNTIIAGRYNATNNNSGSDCFYVFSNGNVQNTNNSYTAISDIKLKENVVDANSQWDDLKALKVRNYNLKEGQTHKQIGLIAQEVEPISPGLVYESPDRDAEGNDLGTVTKSVNYSVLYMKAVKALQEAMERIEQLEAEMAEVKAQLS